MARFRIRVEASVEALAEVPCNVNESRSLGDEHSDRKTGETSSTNRDKIDKV